MEQAPTGTVTFLFTDIVGSTRLWERQPDAMRDALARHDAIMRSVIERNAGYVFATGGDGFAVAFPRAADAVTTAVEAQRALCREAWPVGVELRVRMAAHSGEVVERDGDYFGPAVNRAARLLGLAAGGQVVCSHIVAALCGTVPEIEFVDAGTHELRGVAEPMAVHVLTSTGLPDLPLPTTTPLGGNLARNATEFVGRVSELDRVAAALVQSRLLTLTGAGGVGKTRLAVEVAWRTADEFPDGVWVVELGAITELEAVSHALASALAVRPLAGQDLDDAIFDTLRSRTCLLLLDNCEHVIDAVEKLVARSLRECASVTVLATSREPLDVAEERVWRVRSLDATEAVELFATRAQYADASAPIDDGDRATVAAICERLDGIPLAIELAAARLRSMTTAELLERLDDRFRLLRGSRRGAVERHQTLRAAVTWSYQLLTEDEQALFDQCAVFAGSFDVDAVEAVCRPVDPIEELSSLVDKSMIVSERTGRGTRYRLLETLRQYAEEQLDQRGLGAELRDRHRAYYANRMSQTDVLYEGPRETDAFATFEQEWDNVRGAVSWAEATSEHDDLSVLLEATYRFAVNTLRREHAGWTTAMLASNESALVEARGMAACWAHFLGDPARAVVLARDAIARADDEHGLDTFEAWFGGHFGAFYSGDFDEAARMATGCLASAGPKPSRRARALVCEAQIGIIRDPERLAWAVEELEECAEATQNPTGWCFYYGDLGMVELLRGNRERGIELFEEALAFAREAQAIILVNGWQTALAYALADAPDDDQSRVTYARIIRQCCADDDWANVWVVLEALAVHLARNEHLELAGVLFAALERAGRASLDFEAARVEVLARLEQEPERPRWQARGAAMSRTEAVDYALAQLGSAS